CWTSRTRSPSRASRLAQVNPPMPAPITTASYDGRGPAPRFRPRKGRAMSASSRGAVAAVGFVGGDELAAGDGGPHRQFTAQQGRGDDLRELAGLPRARAPEQLQTFAARAPSRAAADRADGQGRQSDAGVQVTALGQVKVRDADGRVGDVGDVLPTGDEHGRQPIREVAVVTGGVRVDVSENGPVPDVAELRG